MEPGIKDFEDIKNHFQKESGWQIRLHLTNNKHLLKNYLPDNVRSTEIGYESNLFEWVNPIFERVDDYEYEDVWKFSSKLTTKGDLISYKMLIEEKREQITLNLVVSIIGRYNEDALFFSFVNGGIVIDNLD